MKSKAGTTVLISLHQIAQKCAFLKIKTKFLANIYDVTEYLYFRPAGTSVCGSQE